MWPISLDRTGFRNALYEAESFDSGAQQPSHADTSNAIHQQPLNSKTRASTEAKNTSKHSLTAEHAASTTATQAPAIQQHGVSTAAKPDVHSTAQPDPAVASSGNPTGTLLDQPREGSNMVLTNKSTGS